MNRALWIAASGMEGQQQVTDAIANNLANVNTTGYKKSNVHFQDLMYQSLATPGAATSQSESPVGIEIGSGVRTVAVIKDFSQGNLRNSGGQLDVAIEGDGFFEVLMPDGTSSYTRDGSFHLNSTGKVVTSNGYEVVSFPSIETTAESIDIAADGTVSTTVAGVTTNKGQLNLARFSNAEGLTALGKNLFAETISSGTPTRSAPGATGFGTLAQRSLETSNVEIVKEMVDMISAQRAYEIISKSIKASDEMMRQVTNLK